jgi:site-specific DNA-cytosine methylase/2-polyprenyl-3-methyl-5-hydroxy-6-metoxy-1,4-benzoquinol methylase
MPRVGDKLAPTSKPRAIGSYVFAGGFTLGVSKHFDVACHLEEGPYGVAVTKANFPDMPVHVGFDQWPMEQLAKKQWSLLFGNPPCLSPYSPVMTENGWVPIIKLVQAKSTVKVATVTTDGCLIYQPITGWHDNPCIGQMLKVCLLDKGITARGWSKVEVTQDHKFLTKRGWIEAQNLRLSDQVATGQPSPNELQQFMINGMLLGDGAISKQPQFVTGQTCHELVELKAKMLEVFGSKLRVFKRSEADGYSRKNQTYLSVNTKIWVKKERLRWYPDGKKIIPKDLKLSDITLAVWFMDDGCGKSTKWSEREEYASRYNGPWVSLATHGFTEIEIKFLIKLLNKIGIKGQIQLRKSGYRDLEIRGESAALFFQKIGRYVPPSMRYKLPKDAPAFDKKSWEPGEIITGWSPVSVEKSRICKTGRVYCLDVAETHNFVSSGGVVHNCAAWSSAGSRLKGGRDWRVDPRVSCTRKHFESLEILRPTFWVWESVQQAFTVGREFVDELTARATDLGYSATYVLHNSQYLGVAQRRKRFFCVFHKVKFDLEVPSWKSINCDVVLNRIPEGELGDLTGSGKTCERYVQMLGAVAPGEALVKAWDRWSESSGGVERNHLGHVKGRPAFVIRRAKAGVPASVVMHEMVHPTEDRFMTIKELAALCGFPLSYKWPEKMVDVGFISRGVCPPVGEWLAKNVRRCLEENVRERSPTVKLVDFTDPPGRVESIDFGRRLAEISLVNEQTDDEETSMPKVGQKLTPLQSSAQELLDRPKTKLPQPGRVVKSGSGGRIREMLTEGSLTHEQIIEVIHEEFPDSKASVRDVKWHVSQMKKLGESPSEAKTITAARPAMKTGLAGKIRSPIIEEEVNDPEDEHVPQPTRKSVLPQHVDPGREFDTTSLRRNGSQERTVHRDYAAHFFRWGFAGRFINNEVEVLDVGCGPDLPLLAVMNHPRSNVPKRYVAVDMNKAPKFVPHRNWGTFLWEFNFLERYRELGKFDFIVNLEVIEHMRKTDGERLLTAMRDCLKPAGKIMLSTPVFDGKAAANHIHEWTVGELAGSIKRAGLTVEARYGTFANYNAIKRVATTEQMRTVNELSKYYSGEVIACFLAPLYPDHARNNVWILAKGGR